MNLQNRRSTIARTVAAIAVAIGLAACGPQTTGARAGESGDPRTASITPEALHQRLQSPGETPVVVDVREPAEFDEVRIDGARLAPLGTVVKDLEGVDRNREIVLVCRSGNRSGKAQKQLAARGYTSLRNMEGGMLAWEEKGYPVVKE